MTQKIKPRHPEKVKNPINPIKKKPEWIRSKLLNSKEFFKSNSSICEDNRISLSFKFCNISFFSKYEIKPLSPDIKLKKKYKTKNVEINKK